MSYRRMREWRDIYQEIREILKELGVNKTNTAPASYESIHQALLSGYLGHIGLRKEKNIYLSSKNRQVMIFPGSGLFNKGGSWIVASELVQTSRLFARTVANIQPEWVEEVGRHLCRYSYFEPHWEKKRGQVVAYERVTLYGLPVVERRKVSFSRINPAEAREIFIQSALVECAVSRRYGFLEHNSKLIEELEDLENKTRRRDLLVDDAAVYDFYDKRLPPHLQERHKDTDRPVIADIRSFDRFLKERGGDGFLRMQEADLLRAQPDFAELEEYPDKIETRDLELPLKYSFDPGGEQDGVTAIVPVHSLAAVQSGALAWLVPGMLLEKITFLLKSLPKTQRRHLVPIAETARQLLACMKFGHGDLYAELSRCLKVSKGLEVPYGQWGEEDLPAYLRMRYEVVSPDGKVLGAGRNLNELKGLSANRFEDDLFEKARNLYEQEGRRSWDFGKIEPRIEVGTDVSGMPRYVYPGLVGEGDRVAVRLFRDAVEAKKASCQGLALLYQLTFQAELKQLKKDWVYPDEMVLQLAFMGSRVNANENLQHYLTCELFAIRDTRFSAGWPDYDQFLATVDRLRGKLALLGREILEEVFTVVQERERARRSLERFRQMAKGNESTLQRMQILIEDLNALVPSDFPRHYSRFEVQQLPRFLKALQVRAERGYAAPEKDRIKSEQFSPYCKYYQEMRAAVSAQPDQNSMRFVTDFRWLLEEYKVSLFAPEVKTRIRISAKRIEEKYREWLIWRGKTEIDR